MAIRSDEITTIIKSAIDQFDSGVEMRSVGTVVEVSIPLSELRVGPGAIEFRVALLAGDVEVARQPETGPLSVDPAEVSRV